jgi:4-amino-4-deoxy-L-arabinose transferase-like glycosyltransferase
MGMPTGRGTTRWHTWAPRAVLPVIVAAGAALRLGYFLNGDPFVDEWATMLVARSIWERGLPILPSGTFYGHGMLFSYLDALFLAVLGWTPEVAQLPSLLAGLATIPLAYLVGRQLFARNESCAPAEARGGATDSRSVAIGLLAAALLALDPVAILWAGRARAYTLQQVFVLLAMLWLQQRRYLLFALAFVGAVFAHAEASLLLPGFALGALLAAGWAVLRRPRAWLALALSAVAVMARFGVHRLIISDPGRATPEVDTRPAVELSLDLASGFKPLLPFFAEPYRLAASLLFVIGLAFAIRAWRRREGSSAYLLLYPLCLVPLIEMLTVIGQTWKDPRYLFMLLPPFFLLAAAAAVDLSHALAFRPGLPRWLRAVLPGALAALLLLSPIPEALNTTGKLEEGYGPVLAYVREQLQPGDRVAGWAVPAIAVELGQIDYFAIQIRHEEFIMQKDGVWVDRWMGAPLMDSVEQLEEALHAPGRLWFLTDEFRFRARYTPDFAQAIWNHMEPVFRYHYAIAFVERAVRVPAYHRDLQVSWQDGLDLVGYDLDPEDLQPGEALTVTLHWQARDWVGGAYTTFVHLVGPGGEMIDQADGPPFRGLHHTDHWIPGERLRDERSLSVPVGSPAGRYRVEVGWYDPETLERLPLIQGGDASTVAYVPVGTLDATPPGVEVNAILDGKIELVGYDLWRALPSPGAGEVPSSVPVAEGDPLVAGQLLRVRLVWRALAEVQPNYTVFVHLLGPDSEAPSSRVFWGQHDGPPASGAYPTGYWRAGELVVDEHELVVSDDAAGPAVLEAGMYLLATMQRLEPAVTLRQFEVQP